MTARTVCTDVFLQGGEGSPVTKLADEACDLFKGVPKSQHHNKLEQRIKHIKQKTAMTFKKKNHSFTLASGKVRQTCMHTGKKYD